MSVREIVRDIQLSLLQDWLEIILASKEGLFEKQVRDYASMKRIDKSVEEISSALHAEVMKAVGEEKDIEECSCGMEMAECSCAEMAIGHNACLAQVKANLEQLFNKEE